MKQGPRTASLLAGAAALLSAVALVAALLALQRVSSLAQSEAHPAAATVRLDDAELARIQHLAEIVKAQVAVGTGRTSDALFCERLLNQAKALHGDLPLAEMQRLNKDLDAKLFAELEFGIEVGRTPVAEVILLHGEVLQETR